MPKADRILNRAVFYINLSSLKFLIYIFKKKASLPINANIHDVTNRALRWLVNIIDLENLNII